MTNFQKIKNDRNSYVKNAWEFDLQSKTVMHKLGPASRGNPSATLREYDTYTYHSDPEANEAAKRFTKENVGRPSWQVNGELYADLQYKMRKIEETLGVLLSEPTEETLEKSAALREAYRKYKFVEKLALEDK